MPEDACVDWLAYETLSCCVQLLAGGKKNQVDSEGKCWPPASVEIPERSMDCVRIIVEAYFEMIRDLQWENPLVFAHGKVAADALSFHPVAHPVAQADALKFHPVAHPRFKLPTCVQFGVSKRIHGIKIIANVHEAFITRNLGAVSLYLI